MARQYYHQEVERRWQQAWERDGVFRVSDDQLVNPQYVLDMFPYPSAQGLHVGHPEGYTASDIYARFLRARGKSVLHPMGFDSFGLPAENYAIKTGTHPAKTTADNIENMRRQIKSLGFSYDWEREVITSDPKYYQWTQWIFIQLFKHGLAYEADAPINWCPKDKTGLANEEVVDGKCERCGAAVTKKQIKQWLVKITDEKYIERLLHGLDDLDWPESIKTLQQNWIGRSEGAEIQFPISNSQIPKKSKASNVNSQNNNPVITVFTTRPDTLFGATYMVLSPEHELVDAITTDKQRKAVDQYKKEAAAKSDLERTDLAKDKTGVFTGAYAINPANEKKIPIWIADYVLSSYGTGAIMAVPAHDERDWEFAKKFDLKIIRVVAQTESAGTVPKEYRDDVMEYARKQMISNEVCYAGEGVAINSGKYDGLSTAEFKKKIVADLEKKGVGKKAVNYKLRDWLFSRQRYWGEPIPIVHCQQCKQNAESTPWTLHFYETPFRKILSGEKTIETRALNPDEPDRFFGDIQVGDVLKGVLKGTDESMYLRVTKRYQFRNLEEFHQHKDVLAKLRAHFNPTLDELKEFYALTPDYVDRIQKNGMVAWEFTLVQPGLVPVPEDQLPLELPDVEKYEPTGTGESPLAAIDDWVNTTCPECGGPAKRETNTMPQWAGSNWYWLRYCDPHNDKQLADPEKLKAWLPVDMYVGGAEHAVLHLLYARFIYMFLYDIGAVPKEVGDEPFKTLKNQGLIMGEDGQKMSKSRGNVINPDDVVREYGADVLRMYEMFMGPFEDAKPWSTQGIVGIKRFVERIYSVIKEHKNQQERLRHKPSMLIHKTVKKVTEDINSFKFNTSISTMMEFFNSRDWGMKLNKNGKLEGDTVDFDAIEKFIKILAPFAPHLAQELWSQLGHDSYIAHEPWPTYDESKIVETETTYAVQVNGKLRDTITVAAGTEEADVVSAARASQKVTKHLTAEPKKTIFVKDKLVNFVT